MQEKRQVNPGQRPRKANRCSRKRPTSAFLIQLYNSNGITLKIAILAVLSSDQTANRRLAGAVELATIGLHHLMNGCVNSGAAHAVPHS